MARRVAYTVSPLVARAAWEQGADWVRFVQCLSPRYGPGERRRCPGLCVPPLLCRSRPALYAPTPRGARLQAELRSPPRWQPPWGGELVPYGVPVARYGVLRGFCRPRLVAPGRLLLVCPGEPDPGELGRLRRAAARIGASVEAVAARLYGWGDVERLAETLPRLRRVLLTACGLPHLVLAAYRYAAEELGYRRSELPELLVEYSPDLGSPERNRVKNAVDYMCGHGDEVACYAAKYYHRGVWETLPLRCVGCG